MFNNIIESILTILFTRFPFLFLDLLAVIVGVTIGHFAGKKLNRIWQDSLRSAQGLACALLGISSCLALKNSIWAMGLIFASCIIGELLHLEDGIELVIKKIGSLLLRSDHLSEEMVELTKESLLISVTGALAAMASITLATTGDPSKMILKSMLDLVGCCILTCAGGAVPILLSGIFIFAFQVIFFLLGAVLAPFSTDFVTEMLSSIGGILLVNVGLALMGIRSKLRSTAFIVAFILPFLVQILLTLMGIQI